MTTADSLTLRPGLLDLSVFPAKTRNTRNVHNKEQTPLQLHQIIHKSTLKQQKAEQIGRKNVANANMKFEQRTPECNQTQPKTSLCTHRHAV